MPNERDLSLGKYKISSNAYRELKYFCRQYREMKDQLSTCYGVGSPILSDTPRGGCTSDSVSRQAEIAIRLKERIQLIEHTAFKVAGGQMYRQLLLNVTDGVPYEHLEVACGRRQFYEMRHKFFFLLHRKKG